MPFKLAISAIIISLVLPICADCLSNGTHEISRMAAISISEDISNAVVELAKRTAGESRLLRISYDADLLDFHTKIRVGGDPAGRYAVTIICSDNSGWTFSVTPNIEGEVDCICSAGFKSFEISRGCGDLKLIKDQMDDFLCIWIVEI